MRLAWSLVLVALASGCAAASSDGSSSEASSDLVAPEVDFVASLRAAYEADHAVLTDSQDADWRKLPGEAREAFNYYAGTHGIAQLGGVIAKVGTFRGATVYFVAGDVSDTGSEYGFYDADGNLLALAYTGQGEQPGPGGVDWLE